MRTYEWETTSTTGEALRGTVRVNPNGVADEDRILRCAWGRSVYAARLAGADSRRMMRVTRRET